MNQKLIDNANKVLKSVPVWDLVEMKIISLNQGKTEARLEVKDKHLNPLGVCHGGIIATLADTAMGVALRSLEYIGVTVEMNINFMIPVNKGDILVARGEVVRKGETTAVIRADIFVDDKMVAVSRGTYYIMKEFSQEQEMD